MLMLTLLDESSIDFEIDSSTRSRPVSEQSAQRDRGKKRTIDDYFADILDEEAADEEAADEEADEGAKEPAKKLQKTGLSKNSYFKEVSVIDPSGRSFDVRLPGLRFPKSSYEGWEPPYRQ